MGLRGTCGLVGSRVLSGILFWFLVSQYFAIKPKQNRIIFQPKKDPSYHEAQKGPCCIASPK